MGKRWTIGILVLALVVTGPALLAQAAKAPARKAAPAPAAKPATPEESNLQAYIKLLRQDVRAEKTNLLGAVMQLGAEDAAAFWPIYRDYDVELSKINDLRVANILEYGRAYAQMTDEKADELIHKALDFQKQRAELLVKYYERMKSALGAITAARFVQVENQLLLLIDLKIASSLPVVGQ